jgi:hypothetical protein
MGKTVRVSVSVVIVLTIASWTASGSPVQNPFVININGVTDQINWSSGIWHPQGVFFDAGTYTLTPVAPPTPGADYTAYNFWPGGPWSAAYTIGLQSPQQVSVSTYGPVDFGGASCYWIGPAQDYGSAQDAFAQAVSSSFTITSAQTVYFGVGDSYYGDNAGGISIQVTPTPEPATLLLLGLGGVLLRERNRR